MQEKRSDQFHPEPLREELLLLEGESGTFSLSAFAPTRLYSLVLVMVGILSSGLHTTVILFFTSPQTPASGVSFAKETTHRHEADMYTVTMAQCVTCFPKFLTHTDSLILGLLI